MPTISEEPAASGEHTSRCVVSRHVTVCYCGPDGPGARRKHLPNTNGQDFRVRLAAYLETTPIVCPAHGIPDCPRCSTAAPLPRT